MTNTALLIALALVATPEDPAAVVPGLRSARVETRAVPAGQLAAAVRRTVESAREPRWIGYAVPSRADAVMCCYDSIDHATSGRGGGCRLEGRHHAFVHDDGEEVGGGGQARVLYRAAGGRLDEVRVFSEGCALDAGGRALTWLTGVSPAESVRFLATVAPEHEEALAALAVHEVPEALDALIRTAKGDRDPELRGKALFWLAHKASRKAVETIHDAVDTDPDTEVKVQAVFALSQLPEGRGIDHLLRLAKTNKNARVREKALFWLGQSGDDRALALFAEILGR